MQTNGIVLAAGLSSRMGDFKPLMPLKDKTIIEFTVENMKNAGVNKIIVVLGHNGNEVETLLRQKYDASELKFVYNTNYATTDMFASIKLGISALENNTNFFLLPGDMPAVSSKTFILLKESMYKTDALVTFPVVSGKRKHPPLISADCIKYILNHDGEDGLRGVWNKIENRIIEVSVTDLGCTLDADTKEDYLRLVNYMENKV